MGWEDTHPDTDKREWDEGELEVLERKPDSDEEVWADNFHVTERIKYGS